MLLKGKKNAKILNFPHTTQKLQNNHEKTKESFNVSLIKFDIKGNEIILLCY
jgi:hypothetical protein